MDLNPVIPFEPIRAEKIPIGPDWVAQVKWDGVRMLAYYDGVSMRLVNRRLNDRTLQYPELLSPNTFCSASSFILDGEIIAFEAQKPSFYEIMKRDQLRNQHSIDSAVNNIPITYMVFDVLYLQNEWVTKEPLIERQDKLNSIMKPNQQVHIVQNFSDGHMLFEAVKQQGIEGIVSKNLTSSYTINGKDSRWQKHKINRDLLAIVGGISFKNKIVHSLALGLVNPSGDLDYIGHAGTGKITMQGWIELTEKATPLITDHNPFINYPSSNKELFWVKPQLVVKVNFMEWTPSGSLRHPSIQSLIEDIPLSNCHTNQIT